MSSLNDMSSSCNASLFADLTHSNEMERLQVIQLLAADPKMESVLLTALGDSSWRVRQAAVEGLAKSTNPGLLDALMQLLQTKNRDANILNSVLQVLSLSHLDAVPLLLQGMKNPNPDVRIYCVMALEHQQDPRVLVALLDALQDTDLNVQYHAIEALGCWEDPNAVEALVSIAESRHFFLAFPALISLARIGNSSLVPRLFPLLADEVLALPTLETLGQIGDATIVSPLVELLDRPNPPTTAVVQALITLYRRYEAEYSEGAYIADLVQTAMTPTAAQQLLAALHDASVEELRSLVMVLGWLQDAEINRALTQLLGNPSMRPLILEAWVRHGAQVVELLMEQLESDDLALQQAAVSALGRIGDSRSVPALIQVLTIPELTLVTCGALAQIGDNRAFEPLLPLLGHEEALVRQSAIAALNSLGHPDLCHQIQQLLENTNSLVRESAVKIAGYFSFPACEPLVLACCQDENERVQIAAIEQLPYLEHCDPFPALKTALQSTNPKVRAAAVRALGHLDDPAVFTTLLMALSDADHWVQYYAIRAIAWQCYPEAVDSLVQIAQSPKPMHIRAAAVEALGVIGGARTVAALAQLLHQSNPEDDLAQATLNALAQVGHPHSLYPLIDALQSPHGLFRMTAVQALGKRGGVGVVDALQRVAVMDTDEAIAQAAIEALGHLATPEAIAALLELTTHTTCRETCITVLSHLSESQLDALASGLSHPHVEVRRAVVKALTRRKHPHASELLIKALSDSDASIRLAAVTALSQLGNRNVEQQLAQMAKTDPDAVVRAATHKELVV